MAPKSPDSDRGKSHTPDKPAPTEKELHEAQILRRWLLLYDVCLLLGLIVLAILYFQTHFISHTILPSQLRGLPVYTAWFGVLGSIAISLKGIADHGPDGDWSGKWPLWYVGRPFVGLMVGVVTYVLLRAVYPNGNPTVPTFEAAAFILGTQEARFFQFLAEVGRLIVNVPDQQAKSPKT